ncbi:MAG TPA: helix-turn-helix domain-containing protein [Xanthobacteraceae bacterium]|jgi:hypothetical protein|nr:helix-turn-helix domain-containing protein [Xanthobacteraceae bacterium]
MQFFELRPVPVSSPYQQQPCQQQNHPESFFAVPDAGERDNAEACSLAAMLAADALDVPLANVLAKTRGSPKAAHARQVAMYLAHVALGIPLATIGRCFGRDHSTVAHGCGRIEDLRDERSFDEMIAELALAARIARRLDREVLA